MIGRECKCSDALSGPILISRGLDFVRLVTRSFFCFVLKARPSGNPVTMAERNHLFPSRTQQLSSHASKVLGWKRPGRIDCCRFRKNPFTPTRKGVFCRLKLGCVRLPNAVSTGIIPITTAWPLTGIPVLSCWYCLLYTSPSPRDRG